MIPATGRPSIEFPINDKALLAYVRGGGTLVVTGPWPGRDEAGRALRFLGLAAPAKATSRRERIGDGLLLWQAAFIAQDKPEAESPASIAQVGGWLKRFVKRAHVHIEPEVPVEWVDWGAPGGGQRVCAERNLGSAVLHEGPDGERVLFVLNHYITAARFRVTFKRIKSGTLCDLDGGGTLAIRNGSCIVDVDRKSGAMYRIETGE